MKSALPLNIYFFRMIGRIGIFATMFGSLIVLTGGYFILRHKAIRHFEHAVEYMEESYGSMSATMNSAQLQPYLTNVTQYEGFTQLCVYDGRDILVHQWQEKNIAPHCQLMVIEKGMQTGIFNIMLVKPLKRDGKYIGMMYAEGNLTLLKSWLIYGSLTFAVLLLICWGSCKMGALMTARSIAAQFGAIRDQINCLKGNDIAFCALPQNTMLAETLALSDAVSALRRHLDETRMSKESVANIKRWHAKMLSGLLANLRHKLEADSPLLEEMNDYAFLMQSERNGALPPAQKFDLARVLDKSHAKVRESYPAASHINLTVSLRGDAPHQWMGQPELLETLFYHLLLIGLKRTRSGFVCLRLQVINDIRLQVMFEDSGPSVQRWQLAQLLTPLSQDAPPVDISNDISWLMVSRLFLLLEGNINGSVGTGNGLIMEGSLPITRAESIIPIPKMPEQKNTFLPLDGLKQRNPLVLVVEHAFSADQKIVGLLTQAGCLSFTVTSHVEALEWARLLPFSAVIMNADLPDATKDIMQRFQHTKEEGVLPAIPCWAVTAGNAFIASDDWQHLGISELLLWPFSSDRLKELCAALTVPANEFLMLYDATLREEFSPSLQAALPRLQNMLMAQVSAIATILEGFVNGIAPDNTHEVLHGMKSAALTLGYFRLAALMSQIEYTLHHTQIPVGNWQIIIQCLKELTSSKTQPSAPPYHHNVSADYNIQPEGLSPAL